MTTGRINQVAAFELSIDRNRPSPPIGCPSFRPDLLSFGVCEAPVLLSKYGRLLLFLLTRAFHPERCVAEVVACPWGHTPSRTVERPSDHRLDQPVRADRSGYRLFLSDRATHRVSIQASPTSRPPSEGDRPGTRLADRSNPPFRASLEPAESTVSHPCHDVPQTSAPEAHTVLDRPAARPAIDYVCARPPEVSCLLQEREVLLSSIRTDRPI